MIKDKKEKLIDNKSYKIKMQEGLMPTVKKIIDEGGISQKEFNKSADEFIAENKERQENKLVRIKLPQTNRLVSDFARDMGNILSRKKKFYYKVDEKEVVEIRKIIHKGSNTEEYLGFKILQPDRFVSLVEQYIEPYKVVKGEYGPRELVTSMNKNQANLVLKSQQFEEKLPSIKRIFTIPIPIYHNETITFPKKGYDYRFDSWLPHNNIDIEEGISVEEAKKIIEEIYSEFCFETEEDRTNAIAGLLTPMLRGFYSSFNDRTPLFFYISNRERAGKDYCAGITALIYEGIVIEEPPISTGSERGNDNDELRKKILSIMMAGRKRLHFSNNRGFINNAVLEQLITNKVYSDRILGKNEVLKFDNELEISLSGNMGVTFTADLANRCRFIRLKLNIEDPNSRKFDKPNLHEWILNNRAKIISALYALVKNWFDNGMNGGSEPFSSFPEWARVCGGVMECNGFDNPCKSQKDVLTVGGDAETDGMKRFFEFMYENHKDTSFKKKEMIEIINNNGLQAEGVLAHLDFNKNGDKAKFGILIEKFVDRILSDVVLIRTTDKAKSSYLQKYAFKTYFEKQKDTKSIKVIKGYQGTQPQIKSIPRKYIRSTTPLILDNLDKINLHCSMCGKDTSDYWDPKGKPVCSDCYLALEVNKR